jgi:hypothetical protein
MFIVRLALDFLALGLLLLAGLRLAWQPTRMDDQAIKDRKKELDPNTRLEKRSSIE